MSAKLPRNLPIGIRAAMRSERGFWRRGYGTKIPIWSMDLSYLGNTLYLLERLRIPTGHKKFIELRKELRRRGPKIIKLYVDDPPSAEIAEILNETQARVCVHGHTACFAQCGVKRFVTALNATFWRSIPPHERRAWIRPMEE